MILRRIANDVPAFSHVGVKIVDPRGVQVSELHGANARTDMILRCCLRWRIVLFSRPDASQSSIHSSQVSPTVLLTLAGVSALFDFMQGGDPPIIGLFFCAKGFEPPLALLVGVADDPGFAFIAVCGFPLSLTD